MKYFKTFIYLIVVVFALCLSIDVYADAGNPSCLDSCRSLDIITTCTVDGKTMTYKTSSWKELCPKFKNLVSANMVMCNVQANDYEMAFTVGKDKTATDYEMICGISPDINLNKMKMKKYKSQQDAIKGLGQIMTTYIQSDNDHELVCVVRGEGSSGKMSYVKKTGGLVVEKDQVKAEVK